MSDWPDASTLIQPSDCATYRLSNLAVADGGPAGSVRVGELRGAPGELGGDGFGLVRAADQGGDLLLLGGEAGFEIGPAGQAEQALRGPDRVRAAGRDRAGQL